MIKGFILGLSSGSICLMYCLPVIVPFLLTEGRKTSKNFIYLLEFMVGRLIGYALFGVLAFITGNMLFKNPVLKELILSITYILLSFFMIIYVFFSSKKFCTIKKFTNTIKKVQVLKDCYAAPIIGILTGINLCPPFLLAFSDAAASENIFMSILYFIAFFIGTSLYFIPVPFLGGIRNAKTQIAGKMACMIIAVYYMLNGIVMLIGGIKTL